MSQLKVAVIGLGALGSATLLALARQGIAVEGFEQYRVGHEFGASGGKTRQYRLIYGEGQRYTPLLLRARALWQQLEAEQQRQLFWSSGFLTLGTPDSPWFNAVLQSAQQQQLPYELLSRDEINQRFPRLNVDHDEVGLFDPAGGVLLTHELLIASVRQAEALGAKVHERATIRDIEENDDGVTLDIDGERRYFDRVVVTTGAWGKALLPDVALSSRRLGLTFHLPQQSGFDTAAFPATMRVSAGRPMWNTQPMPDGQSFKFFVGDAEFDEQHHPGKRAVDQSSALTPGIIDRIDLHLTSAVNGAERAIVGGATYPEAYTFDQAPLLGARHAGSRVYVGLGLSGHGFKLAPSLGELLATAVTGQVDLSQEWGCFDPGREFHEPEAVYSR